MKRTISILFGIVMVMFLAVPLSVRATESLGWVKVQGKEEWTYSDGNETNITVKIVGNTLYVRGTGAIPAYDRLHLGNRPWHDRTIYEIQIDDGITSIGAEAFSNFKHLNHVQLPVSTFIEDVSAFAGATERCIFAFRGMNIVSRDIGNIPYNSLDSITSFMQKYNGNYRFVLDNYYLITLVQNAVSPKIVDLSPRDMVTTAQNPAYPIVDYSSTISFVSPKPDPYMKGYITSKQQGKLALEIFSMVLGDRTYVAAYNMSVSGFKGMIKYTEEPFTYRMTIPKAVQQPGREFSLIQFGEGVVNFLNDEDMDDTTLTFTTQYPSTVYGLVYRDSVIAAPQTSEMEMNP